MIHSIVTLDASADGHGVDVSARLFVPEDRATGDLDTVMWKADVMFAAWFLSNERNGTMIVFHRHV